MNFRMVREQALDPPDVDYPEDDMTDEERESFENTIEWREDERNTAEWKGIK